MVGCIMLALGVFVGCTAAGLLVKRYYQNRMEETYQELLQKLDRAIGGEIQDTAYNESMDAAVVERLNRVVQIAGMNQGKAERERDTIKSLISDISHQVRTPLTNIMLYVGLLKEQELDGDSMLLVDKIQKQSDKLDFFMKELIKSSYAEQEMISIHPKMNNVEEIVNTACQMVELAALKKKIDIIQEEAEALCYADKKWTIEALGNILDNAVKYSPENTGVKVKVIPYESFICVQVEDQESESERKNRGWFLSGFTVPKR